MKQIIILETYRGTGQGDTSVRFVFWFAVPLARRVPLPNATSAYRNATQPEIDALKDGSVYEEVDTIQIPTGTTTAQTRTVLEQRYAARLAELASHPNINQFYGHNFDGAAWTTA